LEWFFTSLFWSYLMKKIVSTGLSMVAAIVALALVGGEPAAMAGNGCHGKKNCHGGLLSRLRERGKSQGSRGNCHGGEKGLGAAAGGGGESTVVPFRGDGPPTAAAGGGGQSTVVPFRPNSGQGMVTPVNQIVSEPTPSIVSNGVVNGGGTVSGGEIFIQGGSYDMGSGTVIITIRCPGGGQPVISTSNGSTGGGGVASGCCDGSTMIVEPANSPVETAAPSALTPSGT